MEKTTIIVGIIILLITTFFSWKIFGSNNKKQPDNNYKKWKSKWIFWQGVIFPSIIATFLIMFILKWTGVLIF
ncbi:hypothetical protein DSM02_3669 [Leeuwenhoekiella polynyae]|uniref:Uncharacterized protein n=1 Tax=Leeuwenhoekiella polynyae TaxID=1550906 RepID=A0A4Q0NUE2_9FLAO|nr:hypothetical protein DSM02_3669 [Leeuwenhoekiella polynyae]